MFNYDELIEEFTSKVAKIQEWSQDDYDYIKQVCPKLENGYSGNGCTYFEEKVYYKNCLDYEIINITEYSRFVYNDDGDIIAYEILGYDID